MTLNARVTVGLCVKNNETTVEQAIESIIDQDFPHEFMELIIVDGFSKDKTTSTIRDNLERTGIRNRVFFENEGLGLARQIVVDNATGEYIVWVDGDMVISKDFIRKQVEFMEQNPHVGIAKGRYELTPGANLLSSLEIYSRAADKMVDYSHEKSRLKSLGTSGCIYRVTAIRQAGGFDKSIRGYGEDWDAEHRTRAVGWSLRTTSVHYQDYERLGVTWKELWKRYWRRGYDLYLFFRKHKGFIKLYTMLPPAAFLAGFFKSLTLYKVTRQKFVFFLPLQYTFKMIAWWSGYMTCSTRVRVN